MGRNLCNVSNEGLDLNLDSKLLNTDSKLLNTELLNTEPLNTDSTYNMKTGFNFGNRSFKSTYEIMNTTPQELYEIEKMQNELRKTFQDARNLNTKKSINLEEKNKPITFRLDETNKEIKTLINKLDSNLKPVTQDTKLEEILKILKGYTETDYDSNEIFEVSLEYLKGFSLSDVDIEKPSEELRSSLSVPERLILSNRFKSSFSMSPTIKEKGGPLWNKYKNYLYENKFGFWRNRNNDDR